MAEDEKPYTEETLPVGIRILKGTQLRYKAWELRAIKKGKKTRFENTRTVSKFGSSWAGNVITNLNFVTKAHNIHDIELKSAESAVIVASGPSLNKKNEKKEANGNGNAHANFDWYCLVLFFKVVRPHQILANPI